MARTFHRRQSTPPIAELNVIPLIDLAFSILIIFMISTPLIQSETTTPVNLPFSAEAGPRPPDERFVSLTVLGGGVFEVDGNRMDTAQVDAMLRSYAASPNPPVFSIRADGALAYQEIHTAFDLLKKNNLTRISLDSRSTP